MTTPEKIDQAAADLGEPLSVTRAGRRWRVTGRVHSPNAIAACLARHGLAAAVDGLAVMVTPPRNRRQGRRQ